VDCKWATSASDLTVNVSSVSTYSIYTCGCYIVRFVLLRDTEFLPGVFSVEQSDTLLGTEMLNISRSGLDTKVARPSRKQEPRKDKRSSPTTQCSPCIQMEVRPLEQGPASKVQSRLLCSRRQTFWTEVSWRRTVSPSTQTRTPYHLLCWLKANEHGSTWRGKRKE
jgi:hypothetical protein